MTSFPGLKASVPWSRASGRTGWWLSWLTQEENTLVFKAGVECLFVIYLTTVSVAQGVTWSANNKSGKMRKGMYVAYFNPLTPNDPYSGRTATLTSKRCILYIYSTNIGTEYFEHGIYSQSFPLQNAVCIIILTYLVPVLFTFYMQCVLKLKKNNSGAKRLRD